MKQLTPMQELYDFLHQWTSLDGKRLICTVEHLRNEIEKSKAKERQAIIDAANFDSKHIAKTSYPIGEKYFNETYKSE